MRRSFPIVAGPFLALLIIVAASCARPVVPTEPPAPVSSVSPAPPAPAMQAPPVAPSTVGELYRETGIASWYGKEFHGRKTASNEIFDMYGISAAHRTLPLGTVIRVTNLDNFKSIKVKVNDRGPFVKTSILDLSLGAARELGFVEQGTTRVTIETLEPLQNNALYTVQAAVFAEEENARMLKQRLSKRFEVITVVPVESNLGRFFRVRVGAYGTEEKAETVAGKLMLEGLEPIVLRKD